ncbi:helix-turn-helix domain-containing protein [Paraburkholderia diazotrophica]
MLISHHCSMAAVGAIGDAFRLANEFDHGNGEHLPYRFTVLSESGGFVTGGSCFSIWTQKLDQYRLADFHALFVARGSEGAAQNNEALVSWLSRQGSNVPGGMQPKLEAFTPPAQSSVPVFVLDDGVSETRPAGPTPSEMALLQIERDLNAEIARRVARALQTNVPERVRPDAEDLNIATTTEKIRESARWIRENYSKPISVGLAAESAAMSKRNYQRRFKSEFGMTPLEYLLRTRFEVVCSMLIETDLPIDKIARRCGMGDGNRLGRIFKLRYGVSPTHFRALRHLPAEERSQPPAAASTASVVVHAAALASSAKLIY